MFDTSKYMLVAGVVAGGGLMVIANAPNPTGLPLLKRGFADETIGVGALLLGVLGLTAVAAMAFMLFCLCRLKAALDYFLSFGP